MLTFKTETVNSKNSTVKCVVLTCDICQLFNFGSTDTKLCSKTTAKHSYELNEALLVLMFQLYLRLILCCYRERTPSKITLPADACRCN